MAEAQSICISSHNVHGFSDKKEFLHSRCHSNPLLIQCLQEHWLPPPFKKKAGTNALRSVHPDFEGFATSAMKKTEENTIRRGRGFGGTGFIYPKTLSTNIKPLIKFNHDRVTVMELKCSNFDLVIINVYMPFLDRSDLQSTVGKYDEMLGFLDFIITERSDAQFVILGDFNCNIYNPSHPFAPSLNDFLSSRDFICTFSQMQSFDSDSAYTRHDSRSKSLLDYVFVSQGISDLVTIPPSILYGNCICTNDTHKHDLELYFSQLIDSISVADATLQRSCFRALKPYWSPELSILKRQSYICHKAWLDNNKPAVGVIHDDYILSRSNYRRKLRQEKRARLQSSNEKLYANLVEKDTTSFWRTWKSLSQSNDPLPPQIDGLTGNINIANRFSDVFSDIYRKNDTSSHNNLRHEFDSLFPAYQAAHINDDISCYFFSWRDMVEMISKLRTGKSYAGFVRAEHILHGSPKLAVHLHILFNAMLQHSYIPTLLLRGNISPLVKDRDGDVSDSGNYRAITLSSIFIQMYEILEKMKFGYFLPQSDFQFGFKPGISTSHALYCLTKTVNHFTVNGSRVFLSFLDCSKAFDRISHWGIFIKLIKRNVPLCFLLSVIYLYLNMSCTAKWNGQMSSDFAIPTGTKQGGILSPDFFAMYMHDLIERLRLSGFGCKIIHIIIACIFFADDIVLLSPSRHGLQQMLDICIQYCKEFCLDFNVKKSKVMVIGKLPTDSTYASLLLNNEPLEYVNEYKYLGVSICAGKSLSFSPIASIRSFHRAANAILHSRIKLNNDVLMKLLYTNCVPILTYASAVREFNAANMYRFHVAINNAIRKIFSFAVWQSIRHIRISYGCESIYELFASAKAKFLANAPSSSNSIVSHLSNIRSVV